MRVDVWVIRTHFIPMSIQQGNRRSSSLRADDLSSFQFLASFTVSGMGSSSQSRFWIQQKPLHISVVFNQHSTSFQEIQIHIPQVGSQFYLMSDSIVGTSFLSVLPQMYFGTSQTVMLVKYEKSSPCIRKKIPEGRQSVQKLVKIQVPVVQPSLEICQFGVRLRYIEK